MIIVLAGPAGSGKTTVGKALARRVGWMFVEGDSYHSYANVRKMARGEPLDDEDRWPWLAAIRAVMLEQLRNGRSAVVACSALKRAYREALREKGEDIVFVRLDVSKEELARRLKERAGHFASHDLLESQLATLERGDDLIVVRSDRPLDDVVSDIIERVGLAGAASGL
ncbi:MAG: gluconokinase [Rhodothermales bacterium]